MVEAASLIYHMCRQEEWQAAIGEGVYLGSSQDVADGFIHFSSRDQVATSAAKHRAGQDGLVLLGVDPDLLGDALKWEASRGNALFPHLYGPLPVNVVTKTHDLTLGPDGMHRFPSDFPDPSGDEDIPA